MSDIGSVGSSSTPNTNPTNTQIAAAKAADTYTPSELSSAGGWGNFEKFLGKKDFAEFKNNLCRSIGDQIGQIQKRAAIAAKQLKNSEEGKDINDT